MQAKKFTTAVIISPPSTHWDRIQDIRKQHDKAYNRWMPHINLLFPFVAEETFETSAKLISEALKQIPPFEITLESFQNFQHGNSCVMYLQPKPTDQIKHLQSLLVQAFPFCDDLSKKSESGFTPHLTVGQWSAREITAKKAAFTSTHLPEIKSRPFVAESVFLISRQGDVPFEVHYAVDLGTGNIRQLKQTLAPPPQLAAFKVYVGNLPEHYKEEDVKKIFTREGMEVVEVVIIKNPSTGRSKGFGFVSFAKEADKTKALQGSFHPILVKLPK
uniref:RRM domain-containing protein n=1 Tax=Arcella intermedia TaxID=1963864 RepID=A0A6B2LDA7_9EUKA